ncbi:MAG: hypothetical protein Q8L30_01655 [bacterium]|nr:hypothetical protein [bacterium]
MRTLKMIGVLGVSVVLLSTGVALAEERPTNIAPRAGVSVENRVKTATTTRAEIKDTMRANTEAVREEAKARMEKAREEAKMRMETAREEAKVRAETQREKARERLTDIRDKKKQELALKLAEQFDRLNKKWTDNFIQQLDHYGSVLLKIQERADIAATNGKDIASTTAAIQSAKTAIESARTAVIAQAAKTYTLDTSSIATTVATTTSSGQDELMKGLRTQFQSLHKTLFSDLTALRDGVMKNARAAVQGALQTLSQIPNVDDDDDEDSEDN